jgi:DNA-directed RNA polymerase specialized sigma24 family protein
MATDDDDTPDGDTEEAPPSVPRPIPDAVRAYFEEPETLDIIRRIVIRRVFPDAPEQLVEQIWSDAYYACLTAKTPPTLDEKTPAWVARVTVNTVADHFRRSKKDLRWLNREVDVETVGASEIGPQPIDARVDEGWLLEGWLRQRVARVPTDSRTLDIIVHKARTKQTDEQVVAHFGLSSVSALSSRVHYFKKKYGDVRRRYLAQRRRTLIFWLKVAASVVAGLLLLAIAYLLWRPRLDIRAEPPSPSAAPSASASAGPPPFDQALPTQPSDGQKPEPPPP